MSAKNKSTGFSKEEQDAMRARAKELTAEANAGKRREQGESAVQEAIATMPEPDRSMAQKVHQLVTETAPQLWPKTWYGMPAYATEEGKVVCFFQNASKFEYRYSTLGFNDTANLDDGNMWPTTFALMKLTSAEEKRIVELVKKAVL